MHRCRADRVSFPVWYFFGVWFIYSCVKKNQILAAQRYLSPKKSPGICILRVSPLIVAVYIARYILIGLDFEESLLSALLDALVAGVERAFASSLGGEFLASLFVCVC